MAGRRLNIGVGGQCHIDVVAGQLMIVRALHADGDRQAPRRGAVRPGRHTLWRRSGLKRWSKLIGRQCRGIRQLYPHQTRIQQSLDDIRSTITPAAAHWLYTGRELGRAEKRDPRAVRQRLHRRVSSVDLRRQSGFQAMVELPRSALLIRGTATCCEQEQRAEQTGKTPRAGIHGPSGLLLPPDAYDGRRYVRSGVWHDKWRRLHDSARVERPSVVTGWPRRTDRCSPCHDRQSPSLTGGGVAAERPAIHRATAAFRRASRSRAARPETRATRRRRSRRTLRGRLWCPSAGMRWSRLSRSAPPPGSGSRRCRN